MQELIYKQDAHDKLENMYLLIERDRGQGNEVAKGLRMACKAIGDIEAVDAEMPCSVRHGQLDEDKPLTNGDRIRAMTDEELAKFISDATICCHGRRCEDCPLNCAGEFCSEDEITEFFGKEVRHGHWIEPNSETIGKYRDDGCVAYYTCSCCKEISKTDYDFCPNCGAKMDGKDINVAAKMGGADNGD